MRLRRAAVLLLHTVAMGVDPVRINMSALRGTTQTASSHAHASTAPTFLGRIAHLFSHHTSQAAAPKTATGCRRADCTNTCAYTLPDTACMVAWPHDITAGNSRCASCVTNESSTCISVCSAAELNNVNASPHGTAIRHGSWCCRGGWSRAQLD